MNAGHNRLRSFVQRVERLREEIDALNKDVSEIYKEARGEGWNVEAMKKVVAERQRMAKNPEKFNEINAVVELYRDALNGGTINATRVHAREPDSSNAASVSLPEAAQGGDSVLPASPPTISPGALTAAGTEGEGDGAHTPPRTPELPSSIDRRTQHGA